MSELTQGLLFAYSSISFIVVLVAFLTDWRPDGKYLHTRAQVAFLVTLAILWPLAVIPAMLWLSKGFAELFRAFFPKKIQVPKATVVKKEAA